MVYKMRMKNLLFIEPFLSSQSFIYDAQMHGYGTFVLSNNDTYLKLPKENFVSACTFFQVDTSNEQSVFSIVRQINQKFVISGIIPEYVDYNLLSAKIAHQLKKPGLTPQAASKIQGPNFLANILQIEKKIKVFKNEQEYRVDGLVYNKNVCIFSLTEDFLLAGLENREEGYIVRAAIDPLFSKKIIDCLQKVIGASKLEYGFFYAKIKHRTNEIILLKFEMGFAQHHMPKLISHATGVDYNHTIYKLFSSQPLSLHKGKKSNVGIIFFCKKFMRKKEVKRSLETLAQNVSVIEIQEYDQITTCNQEVSQGMQTEGHVILMHEDYGTLKNHMQKILTKSGQGSQEYI